MKLEDFKGDRRTNEYKEYKKKVQEYNDAQKGIGDIIEDITEATGIKKVVSYLFGEDCGCPERKEYLNKRLRKRHVEEFTEEEFIYLDNEFQKKGNKISTETQKEMQKIYERVYGKKIGSTCSSCSFITTVYKPLETAMRVFKSYEK